MPMGWMAQAAVTAADPPLASEGVNFSYFPRYLNGLGGGGFGGGGGGGGYYIRGP